MCDSIFSILLWAEIIISAPIFIALLFIPAPYGKHLKLTWGPTIPSKYAWVVMEIPAVLIMLGLFLSQISLQSTVSLIFLLIWLSHYFYRTFIYPFTTNNPNKPFPIAISFFGFTFNCLNGWINGTFLFEIRIIESNSWLTSPEFIIGLIVFISGMIINKIGESNIRSLKRDESGNYAKPQGGLLNFVTNPHYLGEIVMWTGWTILTWSPAAFAFLIFTIANLYPRAILNHRWYKKTFPDLPKNRKAIIPFVQ